MPIALVFSLVIHALFLFVASNPPPKPFTMEGTGNRLEASLQQTPSVDNVSAKKIPRLADEEVRPTPVKSISSNSNSEGVDKPVDNLTTAPAALTSAPEIIPPILQTTTSGHIKILLHTSVTGDIGQVEVIESNLPYEYEKAVISAYLRLKVRPAEINGKRTTGSIEVFYTVGN